MFLCDVILARFLAMRPTPLCKACAIEGRMDEMKPTRLGEQTESVPLNGSLGVLVRHDR